MDFEWDERKRRANLKKHGLDFVEAVEMFRGPMLAGLDTRENYGEERWTAIGMSKGRVLVVTYTERSDGQRVRIFSLRKALSHERKNFEKILKK